ncbi:calcineurin B [Micractinium conductrix]|uniref:Calcineurin B n=1 Tax=Micractinium conductrix TaxID=554055 RepID=A0A2P6VA22_9CHLO|nr:calcineurin B [Micractinium conductrix]|eukprot:PSC70940.1 calcineurin B [Micractinium conductrix]
MGKSLDNRSAGLSKGELERMERRLKRLGRGEKELARSDFQMIPELAGNPFLPRIFEMFDADGDGYMGAGDLRALLEALTRLANEEERYAFAFRIYDADSDGLVSRADLLHQLSSTNRRGLSPAQLEQIVAHTMATYDADGDGALCFGEFRALLSASSTERNKSLNF